MTEEREKVLVIPCSGVGKVHGLLSREAAYLVVDELASDETQVVCLALLVKGDEETLATVRSRPCIAIDGCGKFRTFWSVIFPLMTPVNVTQIVLNTLFVWNDYSVAVVLLRSDESRTLPLAQIVYFGENMTELNLAFAFFMMAMIPILILYLSTQKYIVSGIMSGAVKG